MNAAQRRALGEALSRAAEAPNGCAHVPATAAALRELGKLLKGGQRGRPRNDELWSMALEYYVLRVKDQLDHAAAVKVVLAPRVDSFFTHGARRSRNRESFSRAMRLHRDRILNDLDLILDVTPQQIEAFRKKLARRSPRPD